jgi:hypothetical protein
LVKENVSWLNWFKLSFSVGKIRIFFQTPIDLSKKHPSFAGPLGGACCAAWWWPWARQKLSWDHQATKAVNAPATPIRCFCCCCNKWFLRTVSSHQLHQQIRGQFCLHEESSVSCKVSQCW